jgi:hypothetical protein
LQLTAEGAARQDGGQNPRARRRVVSPGFFEALGVPIHAGRDFTIDDRQGAERVVIVSRSLAERLFPNQDAINRYLRWDDPVGRFINLSTEPHRIIGVTGDLDDENIVPQAALTVYHPFGQEGGAGRLFVHTRSDPYALVAPITRIIRELAADQPVERAATLEDVRAEVLAPNRLNALVFGGFAGVALAIALVGVAGVLAFSVSGRTRELAIRLAVGSEPKRLLAAVLAEGTLIAAVGVVAGAVSGWALARIARSYIQEVQIPDLLPIAAAAALLLAAAGLAAALPAIRAARVDVMQALRSE